MPCGWSSSSSLPLYSLVATSLYDPDGSVLQGYDMTWAFSNYWHALQDYWSPLVRSLVYGAVATFICLVLGYLLAYAIAFKSGRWKNLMLVLVIARSSPASWCARCRGSCCCATTASS